MCVHERSHRHRCRSRRLCYRPDRGCSGKRRCGGREGGGSMPPTTSVVTAVMCARNARVRAFRTFWAIHHTARGWRDGVDFVPLMQSRSLCGLVHIKCFTSAERCGTAGETRREAYIECNHGRQYVYVCVCGYVWR